MITKNAIFKVAALLTLLSGHGIARSEEQSAAEDSSLIGIRYGAPLIHADDARAHSHIVSVFSELRKGPFKGLRLYYNSAPKSSYTTSDNIKESFMWNSLSAGWSFGFNFPTIMRWFLRSIDIVPRLGYMHLDSHLVARDDSDSRYLFDLIIDKKPLMSIELGAERSLREHSLLRLWYSHDKMLDSKQRVSSGYLSIKKGIDIYFDLFSLKFIRAKLLTFVLSENNTLVGSLHTADSSKADSSSSTGSDYAIAYQLYYGGMGLALAW